MGRRRWRDGRGLLHIPGSAAVPLEFATSYRARTKGLLGRTAVDGALLLSPAGSIHTFGMRIPIDVAYLDRRLTVLAVRTMPPAAWACPACAPAMCWRRRRARWRGGGCGPGSR